MPAYLIDIILIAFVLLVGLIGLFTGFFKSFLSLFSFVGAIIVSILLREQIADLFENLFGCQSFFEKFLTEKIGAIDKTLVENKAVDPEVLITTVNNTNMNVILKGVLINIIKGATITNPMCVAEIVASPIARYITIGIGVLSVTVLIRIIVIILNATLGKLAKGKVFGKLNRFLGFLFGLIKGCVLAVVLMGLTTVISLIPQVNEFITPYIEKTTITKFCYEKINNFVLEKISGLNIDQIENPETTPPKEEGGKTENPDSTLTAFEDVFVPDTKVCFYNENKNLLIIK